jgi:hypothetical protein
MDETQQKSVVKSDSRTWLAPQKLSSPSQSLYMDMAMVMMPMKCSREVV